MSFQNVCFRASLAPEAQESLRQLETVYGNVPAEQADVVVALGGDGFMLETLHEARKFQIPTYGMHRGTVGFLMNDFAEEGLHDRLAHAEEAVIHPLRMIAHKQSGEIIEALAINEVSLLRQGPQAAKLRVSIDGKVRMPELVCDGALVSTPAGSTAYNLFGTRADSPDRRQHFGADGNFCVPTEAMARRSGPNVIEGADRCIVSAQATRGGGGRQRRSPQRDPCRGRNRLGHQSPDPVRSGARTRGTSHPRAVCLSVERASSGRVVGRRSSRERVSSRRWRSGIRKSETD